MNARAAGALAAAATDEGWATPAALIDRTGTAVAPRLSVGVGVSGAEHHLAGIGAQSTVVAVSCDVDAPISARADVGVVGDLLTLVPRVTAALRRRRG